MGTNKLSRAIVLIVIAALGGCASPNAHDPISVGFFRSQVSRADQDNEAIYSAESAAYRSRKNWAGPTESYRPNIGIALSGGGPRSAAYSIGVLAALEERDVLENTDIVSSVSGGSYALFWYISQNFWSERAAEKSFASRLALCDESDARCASSYPNLPWGAARPDDLFYSYYSYCDEISVAPRPLDTFSTWADMRAAAANQAKDSQRCGWLREDRRDGVTDQAALLETVFEPYRINGAWLFSDPAKACPQCPRPGVFQHHLENHGWLLSWVQKPRAAWSSLELTGKVLLHLPTIPINWLANGLFDGNVNINPFEAYYRRGIERQFGLHPLDRTLRSYANDRWLVFPRAHADVPSLGDPRLTEMVERGRIPFFVFNTTAAVGGRFEPFRNRSWGGFSKNLRDTVYEYTALGSGNSRFGFCDYNLPHGDCVSNSPINLGEVTAISGAAVDALGGWDVALEIFNASLGRNVPNPLVSDSSRFWSRLVPFPLYAFGKKYGPEKSTIYLSDGGHSENLGIYSLVQRGVKQIIAVDAESESGANDGGVRKSIAAFESLQQLRCHLSIEHGIRMNAGGEYKDKVWLPRDLPGDLDRWLDSEDSCATASRADLAFDFQGSDPIFELRLCPDDARICSDEVATRIIYVKLALNQSFAQKSRDKDLSTCDRLHSEESCASLAFYKHPDHTEFPHHKTTDLFYDKRQFAAYRNLGRFNAARIRISGSGRIEYGPEDAANPPAIEIDPGARH